MNLRSIASSSRAPLIGGASQILATVLFSAVFAYLASHFGYPEVLDRPAAEVLPRLLALGDAGRAVWLLYGLIPLLLVPTALGLRAVAGHAAPAATRLALVMAVAAAASMAAGLLRWPSLHWQLALAWGDATDTSRESMATTFAHANLLLGNVVGEFFGELFLNLFFASAALALGRTAGGARRGLVLAGLAASALGAVAMWRNLVPALAPIAELNNLVLPVWMMTLGIALLRTPAPQSQGATCPGWAPA